MMLDNLFGDLVAVPGVQGAILFQQKEAPKLYWAEEAEWQSPNDRFLRGAGQIIRRLCGTHKRVELRYQRGRFIVQSLGEGTAVACFTGRELNLPLLSLTLDELVQAMNSAQEPGAPAQKAAVSAVDQAGPLRAGGKAAVEPAGFGQEPELIQEGFVEPLATHAGIAAGLSDISLIATGYLGRSQVTGCWRQTQPAALQADFRISPDGMIEAESDLTPAEPETIRLAAEWAQAFVAGCQLVKIDLPLHLIAPLNADAQALLAAGGAFGDRGLILLQRSYLSQLIAGSILPAADQAETHGKGQSVAAWPEAGAEEWNWEE
ncbi:MAG TPA: hypothetical protein VNQ79_08755 [Blastocatellia bacterium]|nr:hypothetical protein [Blastocatellia bacterium]